MYTPVKGLWPEFWGYYPKSEAHCPFENPERQKRDGIIPEASPNQQLHPCASEKIGHETAMQPCGIPRPERMGGSPLSFAIP